MPMTTAVLFPGQGTQCVEMGDFVERHRPELARALERAVGARPFERVEEDTATAQPAVFCASLAGWTAIARRGVEPDVFAGHSLGELAAVAAADTVDAERGLQLVVARGRLTKEAASSHANGGMLAVLGGEMEAVRAIAERCEVVVANDNSPRQIVLSGTLDGLERAMAASVEQGFRVVPLNVGGAFHSPYMRGAADRFRRELDRVAFAHPRRPVYSSVTAQPFVDFRRQLAEGLTEMVRWRELLLRLHRQGVRTFIDTGPGKVMAGLVKHTLSGVEIRTVADFGEEA